MLAADGAVLGDIARRVAAVGSTMLLWALNLVLAADEAMLCGIARCVTSVSSTMFAGPFHTESVAEIDVELSMPIEPSKLLIMLGGGGWVGSAIRLVYGKA